MNIMRIGSHNLPHPKRAKAKDLGFDLRTTVGHTLEPGARFPFPTGFAFDFPAAHGAIIKPRSGLALDHGIDVMAGVIDGGYQGEVQVLLINLGREPVRISTGDRIAQMLMVKRANVADFGAELVEVDAFTTGTDRGDSGFGSTGIK
ncbi:dUTP diphosphatase [Pseudomonas sp. PNPG3]|uniref:dUTP diphosphatase n=1 Tax=Pseudomonas sp. PNPG3 TaxID=2919497 RepID=UPI001FFDDEFA|nr:dUTP diphosphatase [Pseudomonas sp. PNPG3]MCK2122150.1 dUTP diphosphatase [Pseudomonas sp. PNPG3]